ncbi:hypothetical protein HCN44_010100 [Aphidius gifuensis]|uniref:Microsomal glutathione S-transferase 1 n=2 Tax=Aphidius gifuensis TaxID=684658 RepID=A0A834XWH1_APHGI|nr:hypothetical protein HCN44_010100 [Aphidius gifuensis]
MSLLTVSQRAVRKVVANPEDVLVSGLRCDVDENVERVRRAHRNDMENIFPWFIITAIWLTTGPCSVVSPWLIRTFVIARIFHTIFYAMLAKQPYRAILWLTGYGITIYEATMTLIYYCY